MKFGGPAQRFTSCVLYYLVLQYALGLDSSRVDHHASPVTNNWSPVFRLLSDVDHTGGSSPVPNAHLHSLSAHFHRWSRLPRITVEAGCCYFSLSLWHRYQRSVVGLKSPLSAFRSQDDFRCLDFSNLCARSVDPVVGEPESQLPAPQGSTIFGTPPISLGEP